MPLITPNPQEILGTQRLMNNEPDSIYTEPYYTAGEIWEAAFENETFLGASIMNTKMQDIIDANNQPQEGYNVFDSLEDNYKEYASSFVGVVNEGQAVKIKANIDEQLYNKEVLANSGVAGMGASMALGLVDPLSLALNTVGGLGLITKGGSILKASGKGLALGITTGAVQELAIGDVQVTRTKEEIGMNIAASGLLMGVMGGGAQAIIKGSGKSPHVYMDDLADDMAIDIASEMPNTSMSSSNIAPRNVGAAQSILETIEDNTIRGKSARGLAKASKWINPILHNLQSASNEVRKVTQGLAEHGYYLNKNEKGMATDTAAETLIKIKKESLSFEVVTGLKEAQVKSQIKNSSEFREAVGMAMRNNDIHADAGVQEAAQNLRKINNKMRDDAIELGLLPEDIDVKTADSYFTRIWAPEIINQNYDELFEIMSTHIFNGHNKVQTGVKAQMKPLNKAAIKLRTLRDDMKVIVNGVSDEFNARFEGKSFDDVVNDIATRLDADNELEVYSKTVNPSTKELVEFIGESYKYMDELAEKAIKKRDTLANRLEELPLSEAQYAARKVIENINGNGGRFSIADLPADLIARMPSIKERTINIEDNLIDKFLVNDAEFVMLQHIKQTIPELEITAKFGRVDMADQMKLIEEEYLGTDGLMSKATNSKEREVVRNAMSKDIENIKLMRDRLLGLHGRSKDPASIATGVGQTVMTLNYMRMLGGMTLSAIPDMGKHIVMNGFKANFDMMGKMFTSQGREFFKANKKELAKSGLGLDYVLATRANVMGDIQDQVKYKGVIGKGFQKASDNFGNITLMNQWNDLHKTWLATVTQDRILTAALKATKGSLSQKEKLKMAKAGLDENDLIAIASEFEKHGESIGGDVKLRLSMADKWEDAELAQRLRAVLRKEADLGIVTPSVGDKPAIMDSTLVGRMFFQFKSFIVASHGRTLVAGLSQGDSSFYGGVATMLALGGMTYAIREELKGKGKVDYSIGRLAAEAVDRSGLIPVFTELDQYQKMFSGHSVLGGKELTRYQQRSNMTRVLGVSWSGVEDLGKIFGDITSGKVTPQGYNAAQNLIPYQNLFYLKGLNTAIEKATGTDIEQSIEKSIVN